MTIAADFSPKTACASSQALGLMPRAFRATLPPREGRANAKSRPWRSRQCRDKLRGPCPRGTRFPLTASVRGWAEPVARPCFPGEQVQDQLGVLGLNSVCGAHLGRHWRPKFDCFDVVFQGLEQVVGERGEFVGNRLELRHERGVPRESARRWCDSGMDALPGRRPLPCRWQRNALLEACGDDLDDVAPGERDPLPGVAEARSSA